MFIKFERVLISKRSFQPLIQKNPLLARSYAKRGYTNSIKQIGNIFNINVFFSASRDRIKAFSVIIDQLEKKVNLYLKSLQNIRQ